MSNVPSGQYVLFARATDDAGAQTTSQPVVITVTSVGDVAVPAVVGLTQVDASAAIAAAGLAVGTVSSANSGSVAAGRIISESPVAGAMVAAGSSVALVVSLGPAGVTVPNVVGQTQASATAALTGAGLTAGAVSTATSTTIASGSVISQAPAAGTSVASGTSVALVVSLGPPITLPTPWLSQDIGAVGRAGTASFANATGTYSVTGAGADIWGTADAFRFVYQPFSGDGQIVARVASVQNTNAWVKAGVMIRGDLTPGSAQAMMMVTPGKGNNFQRRLTNGGVSTGTAGALVTAPYWVKLTRAGNTVTASQSADGATWSTVGTATLAMGANALVGLAVSSHSTTVVATATFDQVSVSAGPPPVDPPPVVGVTVPNVVGQPQADAVAALVGVGLSAGAVTTATSTTVGAGRVISQNPPAATVVAPGASVSLVVSSGSGYLPDPGLPAPWLTQDVGTVGLAGSATFQAGTGTYSVTGAGADIWGTADAFRFVYQPLSGDGQIVARVATVQNTNAWVKAGVMIRTALTSDSAQAMMMVTPGKGNNFQRRSAAGGVSTSTAGALVTAPYWVKLTRAGTTITAYQSADGVAWSLVGTATVALPTQVLVGLAVSSHSTTTRATATFDQVAVNFP